MKRWLVVAFTLWLGTSGAWAHRLTVDWQREDRRLVIEAALGGGPAAGAEIEIVAATGDLLAGGELDAAGRFVWPVVPGGPVTVTVNAGLGHRRSLTLTAKDLGGETESAGDIAPPAVGAVGEGGGRTASGSSDEAFGSVVRIGLGLTFIVALYGAWTGYRNQRRLTALERQAGDHAGRG